MLSKNEFIYQYNALYFYYHENNLIKSKTPNQTSYYQYDNMSDDYHFDNSYQYTFDLYSLINFNDEYKEYKDNKAKFFEKLINMATESYFYHMDKSDNLTYKYCEFYAGCDIIVKEYCDNFFKTKIRVINDTTINNLTQVKNIIKIIQTSVEDKSHRINELIRCDDEGDY